MARSFNTFFAYSPTDDAEIRLEKFAIFLVAGSCTIAGGIWSAMYFFTFGIGLTTFLPLAFVVIVGCSLFISHFTKNHYFAVYAQIASIIYVTTFIQWSIGGVFDSGFVMAWAFCGPITALMFLSQRESLVWLLLYLLNLAITVVFDDFFSAHAQPLADDTKVIFFVMNLGVSSLVVFIFARYFVSSAVKEREKANRLLLNILPKPIAETLKKEHGVIAERHENVTVLFADIAGFTEFSSKVSPEELVEKLNEIFHCFDHLAESHGLEKIKTIGDAYMVVGGIPQLRNDHAQAVAAMALEMLAEIKKIEKENGVSFSLRIGIHSGPVIAGVIGKSKFAYDLWGDTVNVASRMESGGVEGFIQVTNDVRNLLDADFDFQLRGPVDIKGKGKMNTWYLTGRK